MILKTNGERLWNSLMEMAKIGPGELGGNRRLALTDADIEGRELFRKWAADAGCTFRLDTMGNLFACRSGKSPDAAPVIAGSHLDTQPSGGRFDGILGVLAALEVVRSLNDHNVITESPIEIVVWMNEEGARFPPAMMGSGVFAGIFEQSEIYTHQDPDGTTVESELRRTKQLGETFCEAFPIKAYYELHIEQGPILEAEGLRIGVVTGGQGAYWTHITLHGQGSHAGTTPMNYRRDPIMGAARIITELRKIIRKHPAAVGTVGRLETHPSSINTIPGRVFFTVDTRHPDEEILAQINQDLEILVQKICTEEQLESELTNIWKAPTINFNQDCVSKVRSAAESLGYSHQDIVSGAGHDACQLSHIAPTGMIFIPCENGLSHDEAENALPEDVTAGADVLLNAILASAAN
ncbi:MAG: Zn-dependent hydrolase [SAR324 cluster bacterium]|nr:Zn-dependent hydrolase [SAR324 cluster bacterium]MBL7035468.1 Zn-dependent hydrolase [SAR324 cluster bacterium]